MSTHAKYLAAAAACLRAAIRLRDEARRRCVPRDRRLDRALMRDYALEWRDCVRRAAQLPRQAA